MNNKNTNLKILCVDDDPNILSSLNRQFRNKYTVFTALSGGEALSIIEEQGPFNVVISDMRMPEMNGVEFLAYVRVILPQALRVLLSGQVGQQIESDIKASFIIDTFLRKPCPPKVINQTVLSGLDNI